jgi:hypothetical protein
MTTSRPCTERKHSEVSTTFHLPADTSITKPVKEAAGKPSAIPSYEAGDPGFSGKAQDGLIGSPRHGREQDSCRQASRSSRSRRSPAVGRTHLAITVELMHSSHTGDL